MPRPPQLALLLASARGALEAGGTRQAPCSPTAPTALSLLAPTSEAYGSLLGRWLSSSSPGAEPPGERRGAAATQPRQPSHTAHAAGGRRGQVKQAAAAAAAVVGTTSAAAEDAGPAAAAAASPPGLLAVLGAMAGVARGLSGAGLGQATFGIQVGQGQYAKATVSVTLQSVRVALRRAGHCTAVRLKQHASGNKGTNECLQCTRTCASQQLVQWTPSTTDPLSSGRIVHTTAALQSA